MSPVISQSDQQIDSDAAMPRNYRAAPGQATTYGDASAVCRAVLARQTTTERALLWRWCIGITAVYAGVTALLAIVVLVLN
jgi:hypothetical protein